MCLNGGAVEFFAEEASLLPRLSLVVFSLSRPYSGQFPIRPYNKVSDSVKQNKKVTHRLYSQFHFPFFQMPTNTQQIHRRGRSNGRFMTTAYKIHCIRVNRSHSWVPWTTPNGSCSGVQ